MHLEHIRKFYHYGMHHRRGCEVLEHLPCIRDIGFDPRLGQTYVVKTGSDSFMESATDSRR